MYYAYTLATEDVRDAYDPKHKIDIIIICVFIFLCETRYISVSVFVVVFCMLPRNNRFVGALHLSFASLTWLKQAFSLQVELEPQAGQQHPLPKAVDAVDTKED